MKGGNDRDRAFERLLRQSFGAGSGAVTSDLCLDAETLAAWLDGSLDDRALAMTEAHVAECARCQALAGATVRAEPDKTARAPWWKPAWSAGWLVPLTAAAGAVVLWMAVPGQGPVPRASDQYQPPARAETPSSSEPASGGGPPARVDDLSSRRAEAAREERAVPAPAAPPSVTEMKADASRQAAGSPRSDEKTASADRVANAAESERDRAAGAPAAERPAAQALGRVPQSAPSREIVSPDPASRWRLGADGSVEHSADGGSTWEMQATGISTELTAAASPAPSVCWLAGRGGVVLLTIDGRRWQRVAFPERVDLAVVQATDARTATVTTIDGRTYRTTDGGQAWVGP